MPSNETVNVQADAVQIILASYRALGAIIDTLLLISASSDLQSLYLQGLVKVIQT